MSRATFPLARMQTSTTNVDEGQVHKKVQGRAYQLSTETATLIIKLDLNCVGTEESSLV